MKLSWKNLFFFLVIIAVLFFLTRSVDIRDLTAPGSGPAGDTARVIDVIDGDTIRVQFADGTVEKVRYIGINAPELDRPGGKEARQINEQLVGGKVVTLIRDVSERDRYGRLLRYVYVDSLFVNAELVRRGYARAATYPPDVRYADYFVKLEREARQKGAGLWSGP